MNRYIKNGLLWSRRKRSAFYICHPFFIDSFVTKTERNPASLKNKVTHCRTLLLWKKLKRNLIKRLQIQIQPRPMFSCYSTIEFKKSPYGWAKMPPRLMPSKCTISLVQAVNTIFLYFLSRASLQILAGKIMKNSGLKASKGEILHNYAGNSIATKRVKSSERMNKYFICWLF